MKSMKRMTPATSDTIGWVCGSQFATVWPALTAAPSLTVDRRAVRHLVALALAAVRRRCTDNSPERDTATRWPAGVRDASSGC